MNEEKLMLLVDKLAEVSNLAAELDIDLREFLQAAGRKINTVTDQRFAEDIQTIKLAWSPVTDRVQ